MRIIFMGTPEFAVPSLDAAARRHQLLAVVTQPDRRSGRGQKLQFSPVKERALQYQVPIYQPEKVNTPGFLEEMAKYEPDAIIVVAFGHKIPKAMLELPSHGCINVHASLLPKYRGAAPIHHAIMNGERVTGVTTMYLSEGWDEGDLILQAEEPILPTDTAGTLHDRLALKGAALLAETLDLLNAGTAPRVPQDHQQATYAPKLS
ncbi:MAG: methionyl-tRNA formyltransferase, partial [Limnochordia bacterium]